MTKYSNEELDQYIQSYPRVNASGYGYSGKYTYQSQVGLGAVTFHRTLEAARKNVAKILREKARITALPEGAFVG